MANIKNTTSNTLLSGTSGNDSIQNGWYDYDKDKLVSGGSKVTINAGAGNDSIDNSGDSVSIDGGDGDDTIENGDWWLYDGGSNITIDAGAGNDKIRNYGDSVTIDAGNGNDMISLDSYSENALILYKSGDGNDTIHDFNSTSTLSISGSSYSTRGCW